MTLLLVRHGQASFGAADYDQLSDRGVEQSRRLGQWLVDGGLKAGERVIVEGLQKVRPGMQVRVVEAATSNPQPVAPAAGDVE